MPTESDRGVRQSEHAVLVAPRALPDWDAARVFLAVVRKGSFRAAADELGQSFNSLRDRVRALEKALGVTLLTRHVDGVRLTAEGEEVFAAAKEMEEVAFRVARARPAPDATVTGEVRLAVTEGLGTFWIAPRLVEFQRANPKLMIHLNCAMKSADVLRLEADVAIQITRPTTPDLMVAKLGSLHLYPFAAPSYIDTFGKPSNPKDLLNHRILIQADDNTHLRYLYDRLFPGVPPVGLVALRTNVSSAFYWTLAKGGGIGILPTYAKALGASLIPLDLGIHETLDIWMSYHPDAKRIPRVSRLIEWVSHAFAPQKYPWFRDEFIHPDELQDAYHGEPMTNLFAGFHAASAR